MAVVKEFVHTNGARVIVRDDCYKAITEEEIERRRAEVLRVMAQIIYSSKKENETA